MIETIIVAALTTGAIQLAIWAAKSRSKQPAEEAQPIAVKTSYTEVAEDAFAASPVRTWDNTVVKATDKPPLGKHITSIEDVDPNSSQGRMGVTKILYLHGSEKRKSEVRAERKTGKFSIEFEEEIADALGVVPPRDLAAFKDSDEFDELSKLFSEEELTALVAGQAEPQVLARLWPAPDWETYQNRLHMLSTMRDEITNLSSKLDRLFPIGVKEDVSVAVTSEEPKDVDN